jgi:hypothetical protein
VKAFAAVTVVVLVAMGVGVSAVGGLPAYEARTYGPFGHSFLSFSLAIPPQYSSSPFPDRGEPPPAASFGAAPAHFYDYLIYAFIGGRASVADAAFVMSLYRGGRSATRRGDTVISWPPACRHDPRGRVSLCLAQSAIVHNGVFWYVRATSPDSPSLAEALVDSFRPTCIATDYDSC